MLMHLLGRVADERAWLVGFLAPGAPTSADVARVRR